MYMNVDNNPFPVRLGDLKKPLQCEAVKQDRSLHWLIKKILEKYVDDTNLRNCKSIKCTINK